MNRLLPYLWYPAFGFAAIGAFFALLDAGRSPLVAAYLPVIVVGVAILSLEPFFPERADWRPRKADVAADAAFMALIQVGLPKLFMAAAVLALSDWTHAHFASGLWPHEWPLWVQMILMVLA